MDWSQYYGQNKGDAYVIQGNPALNELKQSYATQQANKAKEDAAFNANIAKLNFKGARDADMPLLNKGFADILNTHQQLRTTNDPTQRQALQLALQQKQQGLLYDINQSAEHNQHEQKLSDLRLMPNANLSDDYYKTVGGLQKMPSIGDSYNTYQQALQTGTQNLFIPKAVDWNAETGKIFKDQLDKSTKTEIVKDPVTKELVNKKTVSSNVDPNAYMTGIANVLKDPVKLKVAMRDFGGKDPEETAHNIFNATYPAYSKKLGNDVTTGNPFETGATKDARILAREKNLALWKKGQGIGTAPISPTYVQDLAAKVANPQTSGAGTSELSSIISTNPAYNHAITVSRNDNGTMDITIPAKYRYDEKLALKQKENLEEGQKESPFLGKVMVKQPYTIRLDPNRPQEFNAAFGNIYRDVTGDITGTASKINTPAGKGHIPSGQAQPQTIKSTTIKVRLNGKEGEIPLDKYIDFKKKYPQAERL